MESAFDELARYARSSVSVTCRLREAVGNVESCVKRETDRRALLHQATVLAAGVRDAPLDDSDRELIAQCHREALAVLHQPPGDCVAAS